MPQVTQQKFNSTSPRLKLTQRTPTHTTPATPHALLCFSALQLGVNQLKELEVDEQMQANVERAEQELQLLVEWYPSCLQSTTSLPHKS